MIGVFARSDHPKGYGWQDGSAHGYVVVLARCESKPQLDAVVARLSLNFDPTQRGDGWYGGKFDLIAEIKCESDVPCVLENWTNKLTQVSLGDNRLVAVMDARQILEIDQIRTVVGQ